MLIHTESFARAGLVGNPSDGYFGKTLSIAFRNFSAKLTMYESPELVLEPGDVDDAVFASPEALLRDIQLFGYYGGIRLMKAVSKLFFLYCYDHGVPPSKVNSSFFNKIFDGLFMNFSDISTISLGIVAENNKILHVGGICDITCLIFSKKPFDSITSASSNINTFK